jgi:hypothetical protein
MSEGELTNKIKFSHISKCRRKHMIITILENPSPMIVKGFGDWQH